MLLLNTEDGAVIAYTDYEFVTGNKLALYGDAGRKDASFIVEQEAIEEKLQEGSCFSGKLPVVYDTSHGALTNDSIKEYGVSVNVLMSHPSSASFIKWWATMLRTARSYCDKGEQ